MAPLIQTGAVLARAVGPESSGIGLYIVDIVGAIVVIITVVGRLYLNFRRRKLSNRTSEEETAMVASDVFIFAAGLALWVYVGFANTSVAFGYGRHQDALSDHDAIEALECFWFLQIFYKIAIYLTKLSCLLQYAGLIPLIMNPKFAGWLYFTFAVVVCIGAATIVVTIFECSPVMKSWDRSMDGSCTDLSTFWLVGAILNMATTLLTWTLPMPLFWKLQMRKSKKLGLFTVFFLGVAPIGVSLYRVTTLAIGGKSPDVTHATYKSTLWTTVELVSMIFLNCLPAYWKYISDFFDRVFPSVQFHHGGESASRLWVGGQEFEMEPMAN